jgi:hypothetical protein
MTDRPRSSLAVWLIVGLVLLVLSSIEMGEPIYSCTGCGQIFGRG